MKGTFDTEIRLDVDKLFLLTNYLIFLDDSGYSNSAPK